MPDTSKNTANTEFCLYSLAERPQKKSQLLQLIGDTFPKGSPVSRENFIEDEFALIFAPENLARVLFIEHESTGKVVATAAYCPFEFSLLPKAPFLKAAGLGLFVTHPEFQRRGLGYTLEKNLEERARREGILIGVLWSELVQFYTKLGYMVAGSELQWQLDRSECELLGQRLRLEGKSDLQIEPLKDFSSVEHLYKGFGRGPLRGESQKRSFQKLLSLSNTFAFCARDPQKNTLVGYALMGKGRDLRDTVHELVGYTSCVGPLLGECLKHIESSLRVHQPVGSPLVKELEHWLGTGSKQAMGFVKVLDGPKLSEWIMKSGYLPSGIGIVPQANGFRLLNRHTVFFESQDFGHLCQLFFGPWDVSELEGLPETFSEAEKSSMPKPLPLYFWGFDSV